MSATDVAVRVLDPRLGRDFPLPEYASAQAAGMADRPTAPTTAHVAAPFSATAMVTIAAFAACLNVGMLPFRRSPHRR